MFSSEGSFLPLLPLFLLGKFYVPCHTRSLFFVTLPERAGEEAALEHSHRRRQLGAGAHAGLRGACSSAEGQPCHGTVICPLAWAQLLRPLTPGGSPLGFPPILTLKSGGCFAPLSISPGTSGTAGSAAAPGAPVLPVPWASQGRLPICGAAPQPSTPREGSVLPDSCSSAWFQLPHPSRRPCQGGETEARSSSEAPAEAEGLCIFLRHQASMLRLLPQLLHGPGAEFQPQQGSLSCELREANVTWFVKVTLERFGNGRERLRSR